MEYVGDKEINELIYSIGKYEGKKNANKQKNFLLCIKFCIFYRQSTNIILCNFHRLKLIQNHIRAT